MAETTPVLVVENVSVKLGGHTILDNVNFSVLVGSTTAIIGPNGAGKSVLLKVILRLLPKTTGSVTIFGVPHEQYRKVAHRVSYIPQKLAFDRTFPLTVGGLFALKSKRPVGMSQEDTARMQRLLTLVGMNTHETAQISTLSGGQMQRVLLAYSLMDKPELLLLDEPSAGIDVHGQDTIYTLLQRIQEQEKITLLLVSHELDVVMRYATQVLCLNRELLCTGIPHEVLTPDILSHMYGAPMGHFHHSHTPH